MRKERIKDIERSAKAIAAKGFVKRSQGRFLVSKSENDLRPAAVNKTAEGKIVCNCKEFAADGEFSCVHILAIPYAIALKNTEVLPLPELKQFPGQLQLIDTTESRESGRGEQKLRNGSKIVSELRHFGNVDLDSFRLENMRGKSMTQKKAEITNNKTQEPAAENNVLNFSTTLTELRHSVEPDLVRQREGWNDREGRTHMVDYVEWHTVADILDDAAPNWNHTVKDIRTIGDIVAITVAITIDGITREGVGTGYAKNELGIKKAEHDALKRAAVKFGIARDLYKSEPATKNDRQIFDPMQDATAKTLSDMITGKQIRMIHSVARERGIDAELECSAMTNCRIGELSKRAASAFIDHLMENERTVPAAAVEAVIKKAS
jgi:hypothetical protein